MREKHAAYNKENLIKYIDTKEKIYLDKVCHDYQDLIKRLCHRFYFEHPNVNPYYEEEDLIQIGYITLINAANECTLDSVDTFTSYLSMCIHYRLKDEIERHVPKIDYCGYTNTITALQDDVSYEEDYAEQLIENVSSKEIINEGLNVLSERELDVLKAYILSEKTDAQISKEYNISPTRVSQIRNKAMCKVKSKIKPIMDL